MSIALLGSCECSIPRDVVARARDSHGPSCNVCGLVERIVVHGESRELKLAKYGQGSFGSASPFCRILGKRHGRVRRLRLSIQKQRRYRVYSHNACCLSHYVANDGSIPIVVAVVYCRQRWLVSNEDSFLRSDHVSLCSVPATRSYAPLDIDASRLVAVRVAVGRCVVLPHKPFAVQVWPSGLCSVSFCHNHGTAVDRLVGWRVGSRRDRVPLHNEVLTSCTESRYAEDAWKLTPSVSRCGQTCTLRRSILPLQLYQDRWILC